MSGLFRGLAPVVLLAACVAPASSPQPVAAQRPLTADGGVDGGGCGPVGYTPGCCVGQRTLVYCVDNELQVEECGPQASCGWSVNFRIYACGVSDAPDPTGKMPRDCPAGVDAGAGPPADAGPPVDLASVADSSASCGALSYVGCCAGDELQFCSGGSVLTLLCPPGTCGWNTGGAFYDCHTNGGVSPTQPRACAAAGDGGAPAADGGSDLAAPADARQDLAADAGGGLDQRPAYDGFVVEEDGPLSPREDGASDAPPGDVVGIDAVGLDGSSGDGSLRIGSGGGCSCHVGARRGPRGGAWLAALVLFAVAGRRRR